MTNQNKQIKLIYNVIHRSAKKIATLVKIANLNYLIQQNHDDSSGPHVLYTPSGQLHKEYDIVNYIVIQSRQLSKTQNQTMPDANLNHTASQSHPAESTIQQSERGKSEQVINLQAQDSYVTAKMHEKLFELRISLFPLLQQFYKYLTGFEKTKKSKYDSLMNKIKKQIGKLDADINEHPQMFHSEFNFLNIIIACEILMACKFVFQEKFRKSKYSLFNKYEKISHRKEFIEVHGKSDLCQKEYVPSEFEEDQHVESYAKETVIPHDVIKLSNAVLGAQPDSNRNQLLYNYFKSTFSQISSKKQYFPYFWLMFEDLNCSLVEIVQPLQDSQTNRPLKIKLLHKKIQDELNPEIDYGILGLYQSQRDKKYIIRGLICLGSKKIEQFETGLQRQQFLDIKLHKVDNRNQKERKQVQSLWQHVIENTIEDQINLNVILHF